MPQLQSLDGLLELHPLSGEYDLVAKMEAQDRTLHRRQAVKHA